MTPSTLSNEILDELLAAAGKATPGPWSSGHVRIGGDASISSADRLVASVRPTSLPFKEPDTVRDADAAFIALANPATLTALITELQSYRSEGVPKLSNDVAEMPYSDAVVPVEFRTAAEIEAKRLAGKLGVTAVRSPSTERAETIEGWQPIETANKNGDHVLIARIDAADVGEDFMPEGVIAHWAHFADGWGWYANGLGVIADTGVYSAGNGKVSDNGWAELRPTHWMPLRALYPIDRGGQ